jgi:4-hydroxy-tetrahydrodipicolinate synthase
MAATDGLIAPGAGVALVTLFDSGGRLLASQTGALAARIVAAGATSVLVAGTTGEFYALDDAERTQLVMAVREAVPADIPVIAHIGGVTADRSAAMARAAAAAGADALIALPNAAADLRSYYGQIIEAAAGLPVLAYHLPAAGGVVGVGEIAGLGVAGIKDSSADGSRLATEVYTLEAEIYTGAHTLLGLAHAIGAAGAFLGIANVRPELCALAIAGDSDAQRTLAELGVDGARDFPGGLKRLTAQRWDVPAAARTPPGLGVGQFAAAAGS